MTPVADLRREIAIEATPETVWGFLVDPARARRWMGQVVWLDPRPGGQYRVQIRDDQVTTGEFVEVDPYRRLVWTWGWVPGGTSGVPEGATTVTVELEPRDHGTLLRLTHSGMPNATEADRHAHGWDHYLDRLSTVAAGRDAGADPWERSAP